MGGRVRLEGTVGGESRRATVDGEELKSVTVFGGHISPSGHVRRIGHENGSVAGTGTE